ncbi:MAG: AAA family ATPase [Janthinobacterium lividum]
MLTRLKVHGFKNLLDVDVWFGPFTCVAGTNGVGKSNLFDAITFLRRLASEPLLDAALAVRGDDADGRRGGNLQSLFFQTPTGPLDRMRFEAEMIVPRTATDQLGQEAKAASTLLSYTIELRLMDDGHGPSHLEVEHESLEYIATSKAQADKHVPFLNGGRDWKDSWLLTKAAKGRRTGASLISTTGTGPGRIINVYREGGPGREQQRLAATLPRTVLSSVNAAEAPTAVVARQEMTNWQLLQFEPTSLRSTDDLNIRGPVRIDEVGNHMPAALSRLIARRAADGRVPDVQATIAGRVAELVDDVRGIRVEEDAKKELLTLYATLRDGTEHPARSLSDGTLRFLALAIIQQSSQSGGLFCLEEPENGIHPERVPPMLDLLQEIATDSDSPVDEDDNPLRQVIVNTHSPEVVMRVPDDSLIVAERLPARAGDRQVSAVRFGALSDTWRTAPRAGGAAPLMPQTSKARLLGYLNPISRLEYVKRQNGHHRRVLDREDVRQLFLFDLKD